MFKVFVVSPSGKMYLVATTRTFGAADYVKGFYNTVYGVNVKIQKEDE
jgi:hypothetical protein